MQISERLTNALVEMADHAVHSIDSIPVSDQTLRDLERLDLIERVGRGQHIITDDGLEILGLHELV